jgi:hypothetical protein
MRPMINMALITLIIPQSKEAKLKIPYIQGIILWIFVDFSRVRDLSGIIFSKTRGLAAKLLDRGLITQKSRDLFARSPNLIKITNYLCKGNPVDHGRVARSTVDRRRRR